MRRKWTALFSFVLAVALLNPTVLAVETSARSVILTDGDSGRVLYSRNADEPMLIASITKIMTAIVALENCAPETKYTVTAGDMAEGSSMYLTVGERVTLEELLYGLMLSSGNDAALAVAHCVAGTEEAFVALMNGKARELGMEHTSFANPNGLDAENHYSSARDMATLTAYALENTAFQRIVSTKSVTIGTRSLTNHNKLLRYYEGCIGVKTGYTKAAGRTLVSAARRNGQTLIAVTLSDPNDWQDHQTLLDYGFDHYPRKVVLSAGEWVCDAAVKGSQKTTVPLLAAGGIRYPLAEGEEITYVRELPQTLSAPLPRGVTVGRIVAYCGGEEIGAVPLVTGEELPALLRFS